MLTLLLLQTECVRESHYLRSTDLQLLLSAFLQPMEGMHVSAYLCLVMC